jgi:predicted metal-dependent phosphotriesterase family hydrolase
VHTSAAHQTGRLALDFYERHGVDEAQITAMLVQNPARYFTGGQE